MSSAMVATLLVLPGLFFGAILFEYFALPFVAGALLAAWPHLSGRAPYSFWLVATGVWLGGGVLAIILLEIRHRLGLIHP
jgi:hypothetical protein